MHLFDNPTGAALLRSTEFAFTLLARAGVLPQGPESPEDAIFHAGVRQLQAARDARQQQAEAA
jgi:hypothetical protein